MEAIHTARGATEQVVSTLEVPPLTAARAATPDLTLRARLVATDAAAIGFGWTVALLAVGDGALLTSSLDELPQLWNVVVGSMSLVGPRPLPVDEAAVLEHVPVRAEVAPGVTGLWQVEARDNPSFGPLQRLDTYYVENLSIAMDIRILASTVAHVSVRSVRALRRRSASTGSDVVLD